MKRNARQLLLTAFIAAALLSTVSSPACAQANTGGARSGLPQDWSHKHLLYTNPDTHDEAARKGTLAFERWKEKSKDPRFAAQSARKARLVHATDQSPFSGQQLQWANRHRRGPPATGPDIHRDWSNVLGGAAGFGHAGVFPAKFQFDINATPSCADDFVVYTTTSSGATSSGTFANQTGTFTGNPTAGQTVTITHTGSPALTLTARAASATSNLGLNFEIVAGNNTQMATNLANAINRNGGTAGIAASSAGANVTGTVITAGAIGATYTLAETLTGFAWGAGADGTGTSGQPTIVAFNQLYSSCGTTPTQAVPATFWSYNTGTGATADTSPVLSIDGTQVAFVQHTTVASLVLLKWSSTVSVGDVGSPTVPPSVTPANYRGCAAPCMTVIAFSGNPNNNNSSPYYDYTNDILYVGADNGTLHKFTGVFNGTPAEAGNPWPVTVSSGNILSSPVYDSASNKVFVGSTSGTNTTGGGQLHAVDAASGALVSSGRLAINSSSGVRDAPILDSAAQRVYAFVGSDRSGTSASCSKTPCAAVYQFATTFTAGNTGTKVQVGRGVTSTTASFLYAGAFDDAYYTSANSASPTGHLYVCGSLAGTASRPTLWQIPINSNVMGAAVVGPSLVSATADCSAVTEVMNGANDYIYASVTASGNDTGCSGACIYMFNLTGLTWGAGAAANAGFAAPGGTSGIIIDNISSTTGASQIYYSTLANPGNAVQASQAALQ